MKFKIKTSLLIDALTKVSNSIAVKNDIPILQGVYIEADNNIKTIKIISTNGEETTISNIKEEEIEISEAGKIVAHRSIVEIIKKISDDAVILTKADNIIKLKTAKSVFDIPIYDAEDYPNIPLDISEPFLELSFDEYRNIIEKTAYCSAKSDSRPILKGIHFNIGENEIKFVSTNSHILSQKIVTRKSKEIVQFTAPAVNLEHSLRMFNKDDKLQMTINQNHLIIKSDNVIYRLRLLEGNYPDTDRLIVTDFTGFMQLDKQTYLEAMEQIKLVTNKEKIATLTLAENNIVLSAKSENGKAEITLPTKSVEGKNEIKFTFNINYMTNHVKAIDGSTFKLGYKKSMAPLGLLGEETNGEYKLLLPVRTLDE